MSESQIELEDQIEGNEFLEVHNLEQYIVVTYDHFVKLEQTLLHVKFDDKN